jgi:Na+-translocating ferredoxin:NAD+ oxidoreductase RnfG subunit
MVTRRQFVVRVLQGSGAWAATSLPVFAQQRVYLTEEQALRLVFPTSEHVVREEKVLTAAQQADIERRLRVRLDGPVQRVYRGETQGRADGYGMILDEIGRDQAITFMVAIGPDLKVKKVALMVFRETRGWEVQDARFTNQFRGKTARDQLQVGADIVAISGATLSSRAFCRGTKKALLICEALYGH